MVLPISYINDGVIISRALHGSNIPIVGGIGGYITPDFQKALGDNANHIFTILSSSPDVYGEIGEMYKEKYGEFMAQEGHDTAASLYAVVQALEIKPTDDPKELAKTLHDENFDMGSAGTMAGGYVDFDETGANTVVTPILVQWQDGELRSVWPQELATTKPIWPVK